MKLTRPNSPELDEILGEILQVDEHGFVRVVDYMGNDAAIVQAARVSYGAGTKQVNEDKGLIRYLMRHRHTTPLEMCELKLHIKMPIFVARQWIRHRTASVNEYSARYSEMKDQFWIPGVDEVRGQSASNKQGSGDALDIETAEQIIETLYNESRAAYDIYQRHLQAGMSRELARVSLPVSIYTEMYWKIDLHNLLHFLSLRSDSHAQKQIRDYSDTILHKVVKPWVPLTFDAFTDYRMGGAFFSAQELDVIQTILNGTEENITETFKILSMMKKDGQISAREITEFKSKLGLTDHVDETENA